MAAQPDARPHDGLAPNLARAGAGWVRASRLTSGAALGGLLRAARQRWPASPHVYAALAWKSYAFWAALPAVLGYATGTRLPLLYPERVFVRWAPQAPLVTVALDRVTVAVLPHDKLAKHPSTLVVADRHEALALLRTSLVDAHLAPLIGQLAARSKLGARTLWGSVASGIAHGVARAASVLPDRAVTISEELLAGLGLDDLVELAEGPDRSLRVRRRTCCLAFKLPQPKVCTDCCLR
jgi:hypothetical protein